MSEENVELTRRAYAMFASGDLSGVSALFAADAEIAIAGGDDRRRGPDGFRQAVEETREVFEDYRVEPERFIDAGDAVIVPVRISAQGKGSGVRLEARIVHAWRVAAGKVVQGGMYPSEGEALAALGLSEPLSDITELVQRGLEALNRHDIESFVALMADDVEAAPRIAAVDGIYRGPDGVRRWGRGLLDVFPDFAFELHEIRDLGDVALASLRMTGRGAGSDAPLDELLWLVTRWSAGRCTRWSTHETEGRALEAASSPELGH
jgi:ketosteroid isomerase-like protein